MRDFTNLADNSCYQAEIFLHKNIPFLEDDEALLTRLGSPRLLLRLFVSVLGPFYHCYVEQMTDSYQFELVELVESHPLMPVVQKVVDGQGYHFLAQDKLLELLPTLTTPFHNQGEVVLFHGLFSAFMGEYVVVTC